MENNLNEISDNLVKHLKGFTDELPNLTKGLEDMIKNNPDLAKEYAKTIKDADIKAKIEALKKDIKEANHIFRK